MNELRCFEVDSITFPYDWQYSVSKYSVSIERLEFIDYISLYIKESQGNSWTYGRRHKVCIIIMGEGGDSNIKRMYW